MMMKVNLHSFLYRYFSISIYLFFDVIIPNVHCLATESWVDDPHNAHINFNIHSLNFSI